MCHAPRATSLRSHKTRTPEPEIRNPKPKFRYVYSNPEEYFVSCNNGYQPEIDPPGLTGLTVQT